MIPSLVKRNLAANRSYYKPHTFQMSPAMLRAREPYFVKNMIALGVLMAIPISIYVYTFTFLNEDDFDDIPIPPLSSEQIKELQTEYESERNKKN